MKLLERFRRNISFWVGKDRVKITEKLNENIDWKEALEDAKRETGFTE